MMLYFAPGYLPNECLDSTGSGSVERCEVLVAGPSAVERPVFFFSFPPPLGARTAAEEQPAHQTSARLAAANGLAVSDVRARGPAADHQRRTGRRDTRQRARRRN